MAKQEKRKPAPEPAPKEETAYYGAAERAGLKFFDAAPEAPPPEKEGTNER